jgi:hypothetical protein
MATLGGEEFAPVIGGVQKGGAVALWFPAARGGKAAGNRWELDR